MTTTCGLRILLGSLLAVTALVAGARGAPATPVKNIVLVHGALTDGSPWRGVYDILTKDGFRVRVVQQPLTGFADDVAATKRVIAGVAADVPQAEAQYLAQAQMPVAAAAFDAPVK